jgi:hypothetical protein
MLPGSGVTPDPLKGVRPTPNPDGIIPTFHGMFSCRIIS